MEDYGEDINVHCVCSANMIHVAMDKLDSADHRATMEIPPDADGKTMRLMCLIWEDHPDLRVLGHKQGKPLSTGTRRLPQGVQQIFGMVPNYSRCRWSLSPFPMGNKDCISQLHEGSLYLDAWANREEVQTSHAHVCFTRASRKDGPRPLDELGFARINVAVRWPEQPRPPATRSLGPAMLAGIAAPVTTGSSTVFHFSPDDRDLAAFTEVTERWECPLCGALGMHLQASHDMFQYSFKSTGVNHMPEVWVRGWTQDASSARYTAALRSPASGAVLYEATAAKEFTFARSVQKKQRTQRLLQQLAPSPARSEEPHSDQDMTEAVGHAWRSPPYADTAEPSAARGKQPKQEVKKGKGAKAEKRKGPSASQGQRRLRGESGGGPGTSAGSAPAASVGGGGSDGAGPSGTANEPVGPPKAGRPAGAKKARLGSQPPPLPADSQLQPVAQTGSLRHNTYFHSRNCQAMELAEVLSDRDSDDDFDEEECLKTNQQLLEHCPSNPTPGEQHLMLLWNVHIAKHPIYSDGLTAQACARFAAAHAAQLGAPSLRRQFVLHMVNLVNHRLMSPEELDRCLQTVDKGADS
eukprot:jgi/Tetstr1/430163/TSEL_019995.t1